MDRKLNLAALHTAAQLSTTAVVAAVEPKIPPFAGGSAPILGSTIAWGAISTPKWPKEAGD